MCMFLSLYLSYRVPEVSHVQWVDIILISWTEMGVKNKGNSQAKGNLEVRTSLWQAQRQ